MTFCLNPSTNIPKITPNKIDNSLSLSISFLLMTLYSSVRIIFAYSKSAALGTCGGGPATIAKQQPSPPSASFSQLFVEMLVEVMVGGRFVAAARQINVATTLSSTSAVEALDEEVDPWDGHTT